MMLWIVLGLGMMLLPLVLLLSGRRSAQAAVRNWEVFLSPKAHDAYLSVQSLTRAELDLAEVAFEGAHQAAAAGAQTMSIQLLDMGCQLIEEYCPTMVRSLKAMAALSRMVAAITPMRPLRPQDFKVAQLAQLAHLHAFLHQFLVGAAERFRLRLTILTRSFRLVGRLMLRSAERIRTSEPGAHEEWSRLELARADLHTLTDESLDSLRVLVEALSVEP
jgi:hypothetical protein